MKEGLRSNQLFIEAGGKKFYPEDDVPIYEHLSKVILPPDSLHPEYWIQFAECANPKGIVTKIGKTDLTISCSRCHTNGMIFDSR